MNFFVLLMIWNWKIWKIRKIRKFGFFDNFIKESSILQDILFFIDVNQSFKSTENHEKQFGPAICSQVFFKKSAEGSFFYNFHIIWNRKVLEKPRNLVGSWLASIFINGQFLHRFTSLNIQENQKSPPHLFEKK
jgi:hypothetical protein